MDSETKTFFGISHRSGVRCAGDPFPQVVARVLHREFPFPSPWLCTCCRTRLSSSSSAAGVGVKPGSVSPRQRCCPVCTTVILNPPVPGVAAEPDLCSRRTQIVPRLAHGSGDSCFTRREGLHLPAAHGSSALPHGQRPLAATGGYGSNNSRGRIAAHVVGQLDCTAKAEPAHVRRERAQRVDLLLGLGLPESALRPAARVSALSGPSGQ